MTYIKKYLDMHKKYEEEYGKDKYILLMQVGSFYELYATKTEGPNLDIISKQTNMIKSRKDKTTNAEISIDNPYFMGFPENSLEKYTQILLQYNYTILIIDQIKIDNKIERKISQIITSGTYLDNLDIKSNYILCVYLTTNKKRNNKILYASGITLVDLSTNKIYISENYSTILDEYFTFNEIKRFIEMNKPKEILIYYDNDIKQEQIEKELNGNNIIYKIINNEYKNLEYQQETLKEVYKKYITNLSIIETLNLELFPLIIISLISVINYINKTNKKLLANIQIPELYADQETMILGNNAILQLNLFETENVPYKYKCLFDIINKTLTPMGERYLIQKLLTPTINKDKLNEIYNGTDYLLNNKINIDKYLNNIKDIEKIGRKIQLNICKPYELYILYKSYEQIKELRENKILNKTFNIKIKVNEINDLLEYIRTKFNIDELQKFINYKTNIFNDNQYDDIDNLTKCVSNVADLYNEIKKIMIEEYKLKYKKTINLKINKKDEYYFSCSTKIGKDLMEIMKGKVYTINGNCINMEKKMETKILKNMRITLKGINNTDDDDKLEEMIKMYYMKEINIINERFNETLNRGIEYIVMLDFLNCNQKLKTELNYSRPKIINKAYGYVRAEKLRHPIIEAIIDTPYIPHNIEIGEELKGMLIYGINSSGKSSLMKKLGLSLILAQSGLYVPAHTFEFSPYKAIYTRISAQDDIFKGHSSFAVEMIELNNIIKYANEYTLIIGDEICRSMENISGNAIVASTILSLINKNASFLIATHLHELMTLEEITSLKKVKAYHIDVKYINGKLEYNRELLEGSGDNIYGITVANFILQNKEFIQCANDIKNKLLKQTDIINNKTSKYNNKLYKTKCGICGTNELLETHHIHHQKDCKDGFINDKEHIHKNNISNLIVICSSCHDKIHANKIKLSDYVLTSNGKEINIIKNE